MGLVKRLSDYALRGGSGRMRITPSTTERGNFFKRGGFSGPGHMYGDFMSVGVGNAYKGSRKKQIDTLAKARAKLEKKWMQDRVLDIESRKLDQAERASLAEERAAILESGSPEDLKAFDERPDVRASQQRALWRAAEDYQNQPGLDVETMKKLYGFKSENDPPPTPKTPVGAQGGEKRTKNRQVQVNSTGRPVELRGLHPNGRDVLVQDPITLEEYYVPKEDIGKRASKVNPWSAPTGT